MIVYVETNFILELALEQEQHQAANQILELVERGKLEFAFPGFSISESLSKITRQRIERDNLHNSLVKIRRELKRSAPYQQRVNEKKKVSYQRIEKELGLYNCTFFNNFRAWFAHY